MDSDSTENQVSSDGVKEILAPAEGPRENLINTAIKFLQNPKVMTSPLYQKKAFLEKKGLTQVEIDLAVQRAGVVETTSASMAVSSSSTHPGQTAQIGPPQVYQAGIVQPHYVPIPPQSGWARARDLTITTAVVASVSYVVYQLFQKYFRTWLLGKSDHERRLDRLEQEIKAIQSMQDSLSQISATLATIQASLVEQQQQNITNRGESQGFADLKADIASLKGLMLNKNQFPALPTTAPILPSWQRAPASNATPSASTSASISSSLPTDSSSSTAAAPTNNVTQEETPSDQINKHSEDLEEKRETKEKPVKDDNQVSLEQTEQKKLEMASVGEEEAKAIDMDNSDTNFTVNGTAEAALSSDA
ncbi:hypothetical protein RRG08_016466 [Elysia crispata]|uniref:Peroxisomal membrane protein PEX14 n=1 Tax=Elysia crispata TaxID=231223 RepID=A0AAE0Y9W2_9GAST|nr:hypothetical protein RRG08_016466 [Elysia crispata]